jgi:hypothetical protein
MDSLLERKAPKKFTQVKGFEEEQKSDRGPGLRLRFPMIERYLILLEARS